MSLKLLSMKVPSARQMIRASKNLTLVMLVWLLLAPVAWTQTAVWEGVERIIAIGDIHGDYDNYIQLLQEAGVVNRRGNWIAGNTHLVQLGDVPDRGPDTDRIIAHLQKLQTQARRRDGMVHVLIGNHEAMNMLGDLRYVDAGEFEALRTRNSRRLRDAYYEQYLAFLQSQEEPPEIDENFRDQWNQQFPLGYVEHRQHWAPAGEFGSWVLEHNAVIRINNILFMHAGLGPGFVNRPLQEINAQILVELMGNNPVAEDMLVDDEEGPLWYRGFAFNTEAAESDHLKQLLDYYQADYIVVGHTPGYGTVVPRFEGRVMLIDSGISSYYGGHRAALLYEGGAFSTIQQGTEVTLPGAELGELLDYLRRMQELEPDAPNLPRLIYSLEHPEESVELETDTETL